MGAVRRRRLSDAGFRSARRQAGDHAVQVVEIDDTVARQVARGIARAHEHVDAVEVVVVDVAVTVAVADDPAPVDEDRDEVVDVHGQVGIDVAVAERLAAVDRAGAPLDDDGHDVVDVDVAVAGGVAARPHAQRRDVHGQRPRAIAAEGGLDDRDVVRVAVAVVVEIAGGILTRGQRQDQGEIVEIDLVVAVEVGLVDDHAPADRRSASGTARASAARRRPPRPR